MIILQSILEALESLSSNKMRSGLTIIGIVIGVAAVIAIVSIGRGAENTITGSIQGIGQPLLSLAADRRIYATETANPGRYDSNSGPLPGSFSSRCGACIAGQWRSLCRR
jgi:ABC-type lipoprotein release transport system permease subunit